MAFDPSSWANVTACSEPILLRPGGSYVTVITGPPRADVRKATTREAGVRTRAPTRDHAYCLAAQTASPATAAPYAAFGEGNAWACRLGGEYEWQGSGGSPDPGTMLVVRQLATGDSVNGLAERPAGRWRGAIVPARAAIAGVG